MTTRRYELTDFEWSIIAPLLPNKPRGVPRADDRRVLNGIYWRLRTGSPWADIPERYGPSTTCYNRFVRWRKIGVWDKIFDVVSKAYDGDLQMVDSSSIRVHQHAANVKKGSAARRRRLGRLSNPMHGALAGRPDHEDPCARRRQRQSDRAQAHRRPGP
jgi:transposase